MAYAVRRIAIWDYDHHQVDTDETAEHCAAVADRPRIDARDLQGRLVAAFQPVDPVEGLGPRLSYRRRATIIVALACGLWIPIFSGIYVMLA